MAMTRKDFIELAEIVADVPAQGIGPEALAERLAAFCRAQNSRFDRDRFMRACGVGELAAN
jgi:hypothetical protein